MVSRRVVATLGLATILSLATVGNTPPRHTIKVMGQEESPAILSIEGTCHPLFGVIEFKDSVPLAYSARLHGPKLNELHRSLAPYIESGKLRTSEEVMEFSLKFVSENLDFRWNYLWGARGGSYRQFSRGVKNTDCVDYAFLFAETVRTSSAAAGLTGLEPTVMRSRGYLMGEFVDHHDWVQVIDKNTKRTYKVDPTFYDYKLNSNIEDLVNN